MAGAPKSSGDHDYKRGEMDIHEQASTYSAFMAMTKWGSLIIAAGLLFLTMWFMPNGSFLGAGFAALVVLVAGWFFLKSGGDKSAGH